jgi:hypothetical protein
MAITVLTACARKNRPAAGRRIITDEEVAEQVDYAYRHNYAGFGCETVAVAPYCDPGCPLKVRGSAPAPPFAAATGKVAGPSGPDEPTHRSG